VHHDLPLMAGMLAQWLAWRLKLPSILFLLLIGLVAGPVTGFVEPDIIFGDLLFPAVSLGVALVLFEGALTLRFRDLAGHGSSVTSLVSWGAGLNWLLIAAGTWLFIDLSWPMALLFGALVVVTGPTVIMPLLRTVKPNANISNILRWEGILIDPIGALLAVLVYEVIIAGGSGNFWVFLIHELVSGVVTGALGALLLAQLLKRHWLPEYLHNVFTLALVLTVFTTANYFAEESGLLAVTVMGIWLANTRDLNMEDILSFKESLTILIISVLFIVLAARVDLDLIGNLGWAAVGVMAVIIAARFVVIFACTLRSKLKWQEKALLGWIAPRGIVAAAVSALFAFKLESLGYENASLLPALTFLVIIATVLLQSFTAAPLARLLGLSQDDNGILIVGGNPVALAVAKALQKQNLRIRMATSSWSEAQTARMAGIDTYFGNPVSAHADRHLDLVGLGRLFAMSYRPALNSLAAMRYQSEFGKRMVMTLRNAEEKDSTEKGQLVHSLRVPRMFDDDVNIGKLASLLSQNHEIKATKLTAEFGPEQFENHHGKVLRLFAIDPRGKLWVYSNESQPQPKVGWTLLFLSKAKDQQQLLEEGRKADDPPRDVESPA